MYIEQMTQLWTDKTIPLKKNIIMLEINSNSHLLVPVPAGQVQGCVWKYVIRTNPLQVMNRIGVSSHQQLHWFQPIQRKERPVTMTLVKYI